MIVIVFLALVRCVASITYDCDARSEVFESEKYWRGSLKRGVLPCEFKEIDMPSSGYNQSEVPRHPNHEIFVSIERVEFLEDVEKCNVTVDAKFNWVDRRLKFFENSTNKDWKRVSLSAVYHVWRPFPWIYYDAENGLQEICKLDSPDECLSKLFLSPVNENGIDFVKFNAHSKRKSVIIKSNSAVGNTYYPFDKHEFRLSIAYRFQGRWVPPPEFTQIKFFHSSFKIHVSVRKEQEVALLVNLRHSVRINQTVFVIVFTRKPQSYLIRTYLPSGLFVFLSWLSLLVPVELATERVALCTATLLTLTMFFNTASQLGPQTSYLRASDIWLLGCIFFVFIILFENIAVMKITGRLTKKLPKPAGYKSSLEKALQKIMQLHLGVGIGESSGIHSGQQARNSLEPNDDDDDEYEGGGKKTTTGAGGIIERDNNESSEKFAAAKLVDRVTIAVITAGILICNVIYWTWLLVTMQTDCERDAKCSVGM